MWYESKIFILNNILTLEFELTKLTLRKCIHTNARYLPLKPSAFTSGNREVCIGKALTVKFCTFEIFSINIKHVYSF